MFRGKKKKSLGHIGAALVPSAAFAAVPSTPPPTPPASRTRKRKSRKKTPSPSPILPALMGVNMTTRAVGLSLGDTSISSTRSSPERSSFIPDVSSSSKQYEVNYTPRMGRSRTKNRRDMEEGQVNDMVVEAHNMQSAGNKDVYAEIHRNLSPVQSRHIALPASPKQQHELQAIDIEEFNYSMEERQRKLEEKVQMDNRETREMVREVMARQHDASIRANRRQSDEISEKLEELDIDNQALIAENERLIRNNFSLVDENENLHIISHHLSKDGRNGSPRAKVEAILEENNILRNTVHRLNAELEKFQEKYGDLPNKTSPRRSDHLSMEPKPRWLTDVEYLSPLFISYDAQLKENEAMIRELKNSMDREEVQPRSQEKWENLKEQNSLLLEEIQLLIQQMEAIKKQLSESKNKHSKEVVQLSKEMAIAEADSEVVNEQLEKVQEELATLEKTHDKLVIESAKKIPAKEHKAEVNELRSEIEQLKEMNRKELAIIMKKLKIAEEERSLLSLYNTTIKVENKSLQGQVEAITKLHTKQEEKCTELQKDLREADNRNTECESHLAEILRLAEKTSVERDALMLLVEKEQRMSEQALRKTMLGKWEMGKMEQNLTQYKKLTTSQMNEISSKISSMEESHQGRLDEYHREMSHLRKILDRKQAMLDEATHEKKLLESELENVWQATTTENRRIMDALYKSKVLD